jgi:hypothetical protein
MKRLRSHLRDHLLPHEGNGYKPLLFTAAGVGSVILVLLLVQAAYFVQTKIVFKDTDFLASVLPGVLATLTNKDRAENGIPALIEDTHLSQAAQMKADDMAAKGYFAHVDPEGRQPWYWFDKAGYDYTYAGENLAVNFTDSEDVEEAWMNSPTHHANIVKEQYTRIGIGVAQGTYQGKDTTFVVQFFATPRAVAAYQVATADEPGEDVTPAAEDAVPAAEDDEQPIAAEELEATSSDVLGVEVGTVMPTKPGEVPMLETEYEANVQAAEKGPAQEAMSFFAQVAASPTHTVIYVLAGLGALIAVLLLVAIAAHLKVQYLEVAGGGLLIIMVALSLLVFNATGMDTVVVPDDSQPASVMSAF